MNTINNIDIFIIIFTLYNVIIGVKRQQYKTDFEIYKRLFGKKPSKSCIY